MLADCSIGSSGPGGGTAAGRPAGSSMAAYAGWSQERVVWSSRELPFVATHNADRNRLSVWHMRPQPPGTPALLAAGGALDLPALSPLSGLPLHQLRTPTGVPGAPHLLVGGGTAAAPGSAQSAATTLHGGAHASHLMGGAGGGGGSSAHAAVTAAAAAAAVTAAAGYAGGPAAYSGTMLGRLAGGGKTPWTGTSSVAHTSAGGASTIKRCAGACRGDPAVPALGSTFVHARGLMAAGGLGGRRGARHVCVPTLLSTPHTRTR